MNLSDLQKALSPIAQLGKGELSIQIENLDVTLRVITAQEQRHCMEYGRGDDGENAVMSEFIERYRAALLSYAIVQIGSMNLRNVNTIETDDGGRVMKHLALREMVERDFSANVTNKLFQCYSTLATRVDLEVEQKVRYFPQDLDVEIDRLSRRIEELKAEKEKAQVKPSEVLETLRELSQQSTQLHTHPDEIEEMVSPTPQPREPISPKKAPPPVSSFSDMNEVSLEQEEARLAAARLAALQEEPDFITPPVSRKPPHAGLSGANVSRVIDGKPAFDLPSEVITSRGRGQQQGGAPVVDQVSNQFNNPRFRKPNG